MTTGVDVYSTTPASNGTIGGTGYFPEGQAPSTVNDAARQVMADVAAWYGQAKQNLALTGVAGTNTITAGGAASMAAYATNQIFTLNPANSNTGATTLNITPSGGAALGAKNVFSNGAACTGGELRAGCPSLLLYDGTQFNIVAPKPGITQLASGSVSAATLDIVMTSYTSFANKKFVFNFIPATDGVSFLMRVSTDGGSTYDSGAANYSYGFSDVDSAAGTADVGTDNTAIVLTEAAIGNGSTEGISGVIEMFNTTSTAMWPRFSWQLSFVTNDATPRFENSIGSGGRRAAQDTDAFRILFNSGNIVGTWTLYGYN